ncbi:MAG: T9SS type A sorting domain-containing protein [Bacteroidetes bacterium]|nr:T9SS type A sorting domain-containing protein [Bacteroidota bacterium]
MHWKRLSFLLILALTAWIPLAAQTGDIPLSRELLYERVLNDPSKIQSCARRGNVLLAAWGTTTWFAAGNTTFTQIVMQRIVGGVPAGKPIAVTSDSMQVYDLVAVVNLPAGFLILWNSLVADQLGIRARAVDTNGNFVSDVYMLAPRHRLADERNIWVTSSGGVTRLLWAENPFWQPLPYYSTIIAADGSSAGPGVEEPPHIDYNDDLVYDPPRVHLQRAKGACRLIRTDGTADPRPVADRLVYNPHYLNPDTSIVVLEPAKDSTWSLAWYRSVFETADTHRVAVHIPYRNTRLGSVCRDSLGRLCLVITWADSTPIGVGWLYDCRALRCAVDLKGQLTDTVQLGMFMQLKVNGQNGFTTSSTTVSDQWDSAGDYNSSQWDYEIYGYSYNRANGTSDSYTDTTIVRIDSYGNLYTLDPLIRSAVATSGRVRVQAERLADDDSSKIAVTDTLARVADTLGIQLPLTPKGISHVSPCLARYGDTIVLAWVERSDPQLCVAAIWDAGANSPLEPLDSISPASLELKPIRNHFYDNDNENVWRWSDAAAICNVRKEFWYNYDTTLWQYDATIWLPTPRGLRRIEKFSHTGNLSLPVLGYDPDAVLIARQIDSGTAGAFADCTTMRYDSVVVAHDTLDFAGPLAVLPLADGRLLAIRDSVGILYAGGARVDSFALPRVTEPAHTRFQRLRGGRVLRSAPVAGANSNQQLFDSLVMLETFAANGSSYRSATLRSPTGLIDLFVYERPTDSALFVMWGGRHPHLTVLDRNLHVVIADTLLSATSDSVGEPVCTMRNDTLFAAWTNKSGSSYYTRIYGRIIPLKVRTATTKPEQPASATIRLISPVPATDVVAVQYDIPDLGNGTLEIADALGRRISSTTIAGGSNRTAQISVANLHPGAYWLRIRSASSLSQAARMVVLR